jgi:hypothetical protein
MLKMLYSPLNLLSILICTFFNLQTNAFWSRSDGIHPFRAFKQLWDDRTLHTLVGSLSSSSTSTNENYTFSVPTFKVIQPTLTSQSMVASLIIPIFEVCNTPGSNITSCSTVFQTITTTSCSTVLTYAFTKTTITDCEENITFSTQSSYSLTSAVRPIITPSLYVSPSSSLSLTTTTYVQSIVSYHFAPWQSLASGIPSNITLRICTSNIFKEETCIDIQEVWVVHTEYVPITVTSSLDISTSFSSVCFIGFRKLLMLTEVGRCSAPWSFSKRRCTLRSLLLIHPGRVFYYVSKRDNLDLYYSHDFHHDFDVNTSSYSDWRNNNDYEDIECSPGFYNSKL